MTDTDAAERKLQRAQKATNEAEKRLRGLKTAIGARRSRLEEIEAEKGRVYEKGDDEKLQDLREESRSLKAEVEDLEAEVPLAERAIRNRERAEDRAALEVVEARRDALREEAAQLGDEIRAHLVEVEDLWDDLQTVIDTDDAQRKRRKQAAERLPPDEPSGPDPERAKHASGFSGRTQLLEDIVEYLTRRRMQQDTGRDVPGSVS